jgi:glycosyltransferase involved in cell wall biosynthesis
MLDQQRSPSLGVNVVGNITGEYGLGESARSNLRALEAANIPFVVSNFDVPWHRNLDSSYTQFTDENPFPINLFSVNPDLNLYQKLGSEYFRDRYNIGFWGWELTKFNPHWNFAFDLFDEVWTFSSYCAECIAPVSPVPVFKIPLNLDLQIPTIRRTDLKLPDHKFIFLFMFDFHSTLGRKNPFAVIEAFKQAFGQSNSDVMLVLKFSNANHYPEKREKLLSRVANYPSIHLIDGHLLKEELHGLVHSCDCYVSLHRAEGFGLTLAEAMYYGKPVIATAYSSTLEFTNVGNSFLVKYDLITTTEDDGPYPKGSIWANPDIDHAASLMRYVFEDAQAAQKIGARGARDVRSWLSPQTVGVRMKNRLAFIFTQLNQKGWKNRIQSLGRDINLITRELETELPTFNTRVFRHSEAQTKRHYFEFQAKAWEKTARQIETELNEFKVKVECARSLGISVNDLVSEEDIIYCYRLLLGQEPDQDNIIFWKQRIHHEIFTVEALVAAFLSSSEFNVSQLERRSFQNTDQFSIRDYIQYCYRLFLRRKPDQGGENYWLQRLSSEEITVKELVVRFCSSPEFGKLNMTLSPLIDRIFSLGNSLITTTS